MEGGPPIFRQDFTCPALLKKVFGFTATGLSPTLARLPNRFAFTVNQASVRVRSPLLTESQLMSIPLGTKMFQFPRFAFQHLCIQCEIPHIEVGFPIRKSPDHRVLSPPQRLSQSATSFIASYRQDIPRMPF